MKILFVHKTASSAGGGRNQYVLDIAGRLQKAGANVGMMHARNPPSEFRGTGYVLNHFDYHSPSTEIVKEKLSAILEDFEPDIIQLHGFENHGLQPLLRTYAPVVRFVHNHEFYCSGQEMTWMSPRRICELSHRKSCLMHHVLNRCGCSNPVQNVMRHSMVTASIKSLQMLDGIQVASPVIGINLVRNGIEKDKVEHIPLYAPEPAANRRSIPNPRRILLHPGGLVHNKGVWLLLKSLPSLPVDVEIIFAGGGNLQSSVERWVKSRGLGERVRVMGELTVQQWSELYHQSTLVLFPSRWNEPLGLAGLHAMAHGKPVVAFDAGGVAGWLKDGENGSLVKFNDPKAYVQSVNKLLEDPKELGRMGKKAAELWKTQYQPARHVERLMRYYQDVIARTK